MEHILKDSRFAHIVKDPQFRRLPKKEKRVNIDKRFKSMFTDKRFKVKYTIDKRGRPTSNTSTEDLKRYYNLPSGSESSEEDEEEEEAEGETQEKKQTLPQVEAADKRGLSQKVRDRLRDLTVDYARGEGALFSDSSSGDETDEDSDAASEAEIEHGWGELDRDADRTDDVTCRLAVCNMDWDRIRASDLMVLFSSFLPKGGALHSVTIYPSEFGLQRMKEEEVRGPIELCEKNSDQEDDNDVEESEEGRRYHMEKLRQYQLNRLRYFYAVLECDSPETANKLYSECDGLEYESSATRLDLRFVPDNTSFDQEPREVCDKLPDPARYQPRYFTTTALQQAKVELTWDETDPGRAEMARKLMSGRAEELDDEEVKNYLALSSEGEDDDKDEKKSDESEESDGGDGEDPVSKYRALLQGIEQEEERKRSRDVEMEVTWGVGLKDRTEKLVHKKMSEAAPSLTPFQQYLEKRRDKRRQKKEQRKNKDKEEHEGSSEDDDDKAFSDDDLPSDVDLNDPYFKEELQGLQKNNKKKEKKGRHKEETEEDRHTQAELELLLMDDADEKNHFSLKAIQDQEEETKSKKRRRNKKKKKSEVQSRAAGEGGDDFQVNVNDERFSALFTSHLFNIDPADPHYRKTKAMEALRAEKLKRRQDREDEAPAKVQKRDAELSLLVKKIKRRSEGLKK